MSEQWDQATDGLQLEQTRTVEDLSLLLVQARKAKRLTQQDVADKLYLGMDVILKIEQSDFSAIKPAYVKGYLRTYARLVGLSGDDIIVRFERFNAPPAVSPEPLKDVTDEEVGSAKLTGPVTTAGYYGLAGVAIVVVLVSVLSMQGGDSEPQVAAGSPDQGLEAMSGAGDVERVGETSFPEVSEQPPIPGDLQGASDAAPYAVVTGQGASGAVDAGDSNGSGSAAETGDAGSDSRANPQVSDADAAEGQQVAQVIGSKSSSGDTAQRNAGSSQVSVERSTEGGHRLFTVHANGQDRLKVNFKDESWLEITDARGTLVYADMNYQRDVVDLFGQAPFRVVVGRAQAVTLLFNGQPVSLVPNSLNNTAKVELGD